MNHLIDKAFTLAMCFFVCAVEADDSFFSMSTSSNDVMFDPGQSVTFVCTVFTSRTGVSSGVQWYRRQGATSLLIATDMIPNINFSGGGRYQLSRGPATSTTATYYLTVTNLQLEDSSTIECTISPFTKRASLAFAVCSDPQDESCQCMTETGWSSPACFDGLVSAEQAYDSHRQAAIGLGIALAVVIILSIFLTVWLIRSCIVERRLERMKQETESAKNPPKTAVSQVLPGAGVLKQAPHAGAATGGQSVHSAAGPAQTPVNGRGVRFAEDSSNEIEQNCVESGNLYPSSYLAPNGFTHKDSYKSPMPEEMDYIDSYDLPKESYQVRRAQNSRMPHTNVPPYNSVPRPEAFHASGAVFVDPGSTSI